MKKTSNAVLSPSERATMNGSKNSKVKSIIADQRVASIVSAFGQCKSATGVKITLSDGTSVVPTIAEEIVYNALIQERDHSRGFQTLLDMQKVMGENKEEVNVNVSLVDADLMKRALD